MNKAAWALLAVGLLQMTGDALERIGCTAIGRPLKGLGAASTASPAPKVFSTVRGLETFSTRFDLEWIDQSGRPQSLTITPENYSKILGPYNRRNAFGAALAYGPLLAAEDRTQPLLRSVIEYSMTGKAPLLRELGVDPTLISGPVRIRYQVREGARLDERLPLVLEAAHE